MTRPPEDDEARFDAAEKALLRAPEMVPDTFADMDDFVSRIADLTDRARAELAGGRASDLYHTAMSMIETRLDTDPNPELTAFMRGRFENMAPDAVVTDIGADGEGRVQLVATRVGRADDAPLSGTFDPAEVEAFLDAYTPPSVEATGNPFDTEMDQ